MQQALSRCSLEADLTILDSIGSQGDDAVAPLALQEPSGPSLYIDDTIRSLESRAITYLHAGIPVHFRGPAGVGKSTLANRVAAKIGRPIVLLIGDRQLTTYDLIGREIGTKSRQIVDRFVHNVHKRESETAPVWAENVLTVAFKKGCTLIYDEFTRSPPAANNVLLAALEERRLVLPSQADGESVVEAHPEFRVIFTSNPDDYAGVEAPQDALVDRMITLEMTGFDVETEAGIVAGRAELSTDKALNIVRIVRALRARGSDGAVSLRSAVMIARIVAAEGMEPSVNDPRFMQLCIDTLAARWGSEVGGVDDRPFLDHLCEVVQAEVAV